MSTPESSKKYRAIAYIDGLNLYHGLRSKVFPDEWSDQKPWPCYYWLDIPKLCRSLLASNQELIRCKFFTARVSEPPDKVRRQNEYYGVLENMDNFDIIEGHFMPTNVTCNSCGTTYVKGNEKASDVNLAVSLLVDAFQDRYDTALVITGDSDLVPPIRAVHSIFPGEKRVLVSYPPGRFSNNLKQAAHGELHMQQRIIKKCLLPDKVKTKDGTILCNPYTPEVIQAMRDKQIQAALRRRR